MRRPTLQLLAPLLAAAGALGCGYALVGRGSNIPADVRTVWVKPLENETARPQVEQFLTQALIDELVTRQRFRVVQGPSGADAEVAGTVVGFSVTPVRYDADGRATEYQILIRAKMGLRRLADDSVLWSNDSYLFRETYEADPSASGYFDREDIALEEAADRFAESVVSDLLEGF